MEKVEYVADILKSYSMSSVVLRGYADSIGIGSDTTLLYLNDVQSESWRFFLGKGVSQDQITIKSLGESRPVESNSTPEGRYKNRRVDIDTRV